MHKADLEEVLPYDLAVMKRKGTIITHGRVINCLKYTKNDKDNPIISEFIYCLNSKPWEIFVKIVFELGLALWMGVLTSQCVLSSFILSQWQTSLIDHPMADITN